MPQAQELVDRVRAIAMPIVRALALELVDVECAGQGARAVVRVFIDKPEGVTVQDCEQVHLSLGPALDVEDPIPHRYTLEVSSPGLDRPLKHRRAYERALGQLVRLKLRQPHQGEWVAIGRLEGVTDAGVTLAVRHPSSSEPVAFSWEAIAEGRREIEF